MIGLLVCLAVAVLIAASTPSPATDVRRKFVDAAVNAWAVGPDVSARVSRVQLTNSAQGSYGDPFVSRQRLVVIDVEAAVRHRVINFTNAVLRTSDEVDYEPRSEFSDGALIQTQPGFTRTSTLVFELPTDQVAGARLVIDSDGAKFDVYSTALRIELGLSSRTPVITGPVKITESTLVVTR